MRNEIAKHFAAIGAGLETVSISARDRRIGRQWMTRRMSDSPMLVDVNHEGRDEHFTLTCHSDTALTVSNVDARLQHLVLLAKGKQEAQTRTFLCGRDECHWFVAAVPERAQARTVQQAMNALKPELVWASIREHNLPESQWNLRRTSAFVRQGEWFFVPRPVEDKRSHKVQHHEPLSRGLGSQMHWCQELFRDGGTLVWVHARYPRGLTDAERQKLPAIERDRLGWRPMRRGAAAHVRGYVRHADHATITLDGWHEVAMNTEQQAAAMRHVEFLD
jgi:hypothetical protein